MSQFFLFLLLIGASSEATTQRFIPMDWRLVSSYPAPITQGSMPWSPTVKSKLTFSLLQFSPNLDQRESVSIDWPTALILVKEGTILPGVIELSDLPAPLKQALLGDAATLVIGHSAVVSGFQSIPLVSSVQKENHIEHSIYLLNENGKIATLPIRMRYTIEITSVSLDLSPSGTQIHLKYKETDGPYGDRKTIRLMSHPVGYPSFEWINPYQKGATPEHNVFAWALAAVRAELFGVRLEVDAPELFLELLSRRMNSLPEQKKSASRLYQELIKIFKSSGVSSLSPQSSIRTLQLMEHPSVCKWISNYKRPE
jgi:hypothetical protein